MEQVIWDWIITGTVLIGLLLTVWARVSGMTIPELIKQLRDAFKDKTEDVVEETPAVIWNE
ncbi:MAG: hypothetical protein ACOC56_00450 [Atribacterota bacterium]